MLASIKSIRSCTLSNYCSVVRWVARVDGSGRTDSAVEGIGRDPLVVVSPDAILGLSDSGVIGSCNPAAARLYGYPAGEIIGRSATVLVPPEFRGQEAEILLRVLAGEPVQPYRTDRVRRDGTVLAVSSTVAPILDAAGAIVGATITSRMASDLQDADDRERDRDRFEMRVTRQRVAAHDAADRFEVMVDQQRTEAQDAADRFETRVLADRAQIHGAQHRFQSRVEAERTVAQGDRHRLGAYLEQNHELEALGQFAGGVAHDLNNLLAVVLDHAESVAGALAGGTGVDSEAAGRDVGRIRQAAERATALTHQLVDFARHEVAAPQVLDLNGVVTDVGQLLHRTIGEDVVLKTELAPDLWPVLADARQIEQVLVNLAVNARDAMSGAGTLTIDTANIDVETDLIATGAPIRAGRHVRLRVSDTGIGMPADVVEHAFEPFYTTKSDGTGTGLGLATVYGIVAQAEAAIDIHSRAGVGTTFTIIIPMTEVVPVPAG
jgi:PAS domain S-box-containing protein